MAIPIDKIVRSRRKTTSLEVTEDALLVVRAPFGPSEREIRAAAF